MKKTLSLFFFYCILSSALPLYSQIISSSIHADDISLPLESPSCGSHELMKHLEKEQSGVMDLSDRMLEQLTHLIKQQQNDREYEDLYVIPVVFHVVYNEESENIPDSVLFNQLQILNESFRRHNEDASETRSEFLDLVGDTKIEFKLAEYNEDGDPAIGITRTNTSIEHFGGILPHSPGETDEIIEWVNDSLNYNLFRITQSALGGEDAWNTDEYLNVWIGDLRIFEPEFDDFEELVFFAMATPPMDHANWPEATLEELSAYSQGVLLHYVNVGSNNPNSLPSPYNAYNGLTTTGKILVHEVGHYLGLRHIWGDGDCDMDDFVEDTPKCNASSAWSCNHFSNTCTDDIGGVDLPDMVENYMDYSSGNCQNAFTLGQADIMRAVIEEFRPDLAEVISTASTEENTQVNFATLYPNPSDGNVTLTFNNVLQDGNLAIFNATGQLVHKQALVNVNHITLTLSLPSGIYLVKLANNDGQSQNMRLIIA